MNWAKSFCILFVVAFIVVLIVLRIRRAFKGPTVTRMSDEQEAGRNLLYADLSLAAMQPMALGAEPPAEPWSHFQSAASHLRAKDRTLALQDLHRIAADTGMKTLVQLLAWRFLRELGEPPDGQTADTIQGVLIEIPVRNNRDVQTVFRDGSMKCLAGTGRWVAGQSTDNAAITDLMNEAGVARPLLPLSPGRPPRTPILPRVGILTFGGIYVLDLDPKLVDTSSEPPYALYRSARKLGK